jgi:hypothetical protein
MAAGKKATKRTGAAKAASTATADKTPGLEEIRIKYDSVMIALSKAEAAHCLAVKNQEGLFDDDETADWVEAFANDALSEALAEAKAAYVKAVGDKLAPAAEAAR